MTTNIKRTWVEDGIIHEKDISPEEFYMPPASTTTDIGALIACAEGILAEQEAQIEKQSAATAVRLGWSAEAAASRLAEYKEQGTVMMNCRDFRKLIAALRELRDERDQIWEALTTLNAEYLELREELGHD